MTIRSTPDFISVRIVLTIIFAKTDDAHLERVSVFQRWEPAAWAKLMCHSRLALTVDGLTMFTKIKAALLSLIHPIIARLYDMTLESEAVAGAETIVKEPVTLLKDARGRSPGPDSASSTNNGVGAHGA